MYIYKIFEKKNIRIKLFDGEDPTFAEESRNEDIAEGYKVSEIEDFGLYHTITITKKGLI